MKLGINIGYSGGRVEIPVDRVLEAEQLGYDSLWTAEAYGSDAVTPLAYLAAKTTRIKLGTGIMQLAGRTPAMCAVTMSTLDALSCVSGGGSGRGPDRWDVVVPPLTLSLSHKGRGNLEARGQQ